MKPRKAILLVAFVLVISFMYVSVKSSPVISDTNKKEAYFGGLTFKSSLSEGLSDARNQNKPVLIYFWAIWCKWCEKFETETLTDARVNRMLTEDFILVASDLDSPLEDVPSRYGVSYPPREIFVDNNGEVIYDIPGYIDADTFYPILIAVKDEYNNRTATNRSI
ncbi:MAG TPA: thioredoxin fold domain-containing protein [Candidatus Methanoperedenaceae archaeon]|nr:thioredoxin fold domain-containing protein [Candidatus Methanoperedenaceae archaeon]